jgi:DNA helicase II / ATP-dependent DNA helicase PcrA
MYLLSSVNEPQREAITSTDGALLILAGAGSGKTRVITYRIAYLIKERGVEPYNILAVTFTNKAAGEMRERVKQLMGDEPLSSSPLISTFHSLCVRILRRDIEALGEGYTKAFTIYDQDDSIRLIKTCIRDLGYDDQRLAPRYAQSSISRAKNTGIDPEAYAARVESHDEKQAAVARVFRLYEERLRSNNALDFDDLLIKTVRLLRKDQQVREYYNNRFKYLLVDEYQDTNSLQFALIRFLTEKQQNICVVGDDDQSIYGWRGADISNILNFEQHYPSSKVIRLEQNYRSTQNILEMAGAVVKNNSKRKGKRLWTDNNAGERIRYYQAPDAETEARFVISKIEEHRRTDPTIRAAILYRTNAQSRLFEEALRRVSIAYNIVGGFSFYERAEIRDVISYLKLALNPHDSVALVRVINSPARGIGKQTIEEVEKRARDFGVSLWETIAIITEQGEGFSPRAISALKNFKQIITNLVETAQTNTTSETVKAAIRDTGYDKALRSENTDEAEARLDNLQELVNAAVDFETREDGGLRDFIDTAALASDTDQYNSEAPVTLMTMHAAKGLEFPLVFIVGLEDGLFPTSRAIQDKTQLEEERRLCYVAITRAEKFLYITHAQTRRVYGDEMASEPSQFLNEMPLELIEDLSRGKSWLSLARNSRTEESQYIVDALKNQRPSEKSYKGKTYDSTESIAEFFRSRSQKIQNQATPKSETRPTPTTLKKSTPTKPNTSTSNSNELTPGTYVKHPKYGRGLVLRREGIGDAAKLTISFPGFGQKKLIEKYAGLTKA